MHRLDPDGPRTPLQKRALAISMCANLALLGFFKYFNFGVDLYNGAIESLGLQGYGLDTTLRVTLPLGISFYTFQSMSYAIDVYRGDATGVKNFIDFTCFETMFPQLVAGPIIRFQEVAEQLQERTHSMEKFARGVAFLSFGLAKKVLHREPLRQDRRRGVRRGIARCADAWYGAIAYAFQIKIALHVLIDPGHERRQRFAIARRRRVNDELRLTALALESDHRHARRVGRDGGPEVAADQVQTQVDPCRGARRREQIPLVDEEDVRVD